MTNPLFKIRENGKYGFMNAIGEVVIEPQYVEAEDFYNGFSRVRLNDRMVPLDHLGRLLLLPVELIDFQGHLQGKSVQLQWEVAPNGSLNHFELERSGNGSGWGSVHRQLFASEQKHYGFLDPNPATGINYYRLKMVDIDGSIKYSELVSVRWDGLEVLRLSPNPASNELSLLANWQPGNISFAIFDAKGQLLQQQNIQVSTALEPLSMDVSALPPGVYLVKIKDENGPGLPLQQKFVKW